jgi:hypothetical protein
MKEIKRVLIGVILSVLIVIAGCDPSKQLVSLPLSKPIVLKVNGAELFQYWECYNAPMLWDTNFTHPLNLNLYKDSLFSLLSVDTAQAIIEKIALQDSSFKSVVTQNGDLINAQLIHSKSIGNIRPINYLEAQLLDYLMNRYPMLSHPTEFHGFILLHDASNIVRIYFAASDQPWPPKPNVILSALENDLKSGWTFKYHLHNHYEPKTNNYLGILAPSMTDAQYYSFLSEEYNVQNAIITNGFHTVEIPKEAFHKLKSPDNH